MYLYSHPHGWDVIMRVYNWKKHNKIKEKEFEILIKEANRIVNDSKEPWNKKQYGRPPYPSKPMVLICLLKVYFGMPYRDIESLIRGNKTFQGMLGLKKIPDHNTIQRAMAKIPMEYLEKLNQKLTFSFKKRDLTLPLMQQVSV
jgi:transposase